MEASLSSYYIDRGNFDTDLDGAPEWNVYDRTEADDNSEPLQVAGGFKSRSAAQEWIDRQA